MSGMLDKLMEKDSMKFIDQVGEVFKSLPHLPDGIVEFFVKVAPWLALLGAILTLLTGPLAALLGTFASLVTLSPLVLVGTIVTLVLSLAQVVLLFMAFNPLKNRELKGWVYLFWSEMVSVATSVVLAVAWMNFGSLIGTVIGTAIGLYILFEMKSKYGPISEAVTKAKKLAD
jgi:hypothetical protein